MNYDLMLRWIYTDITCYRNLLYSTHLLNVHLREEKLKTCPGLCDVKLVARNVDEKGILLLPSDVERSIEEYSEKEGITMEDAHTKFLEYSSRFLRSRVVSSVYEVIEKYYKLEGAYKDEYYELHSLDWFRVLYVLRQITSHHDGYGKPLVFPKKTFRHGQEDKRWKKLKESYPDQIIWKTISIQDGQLGNTVRYNDEEVLALIQTVFFFFSWGGEKWDLK